MEKIQSRLGHSTVAAAMRHQHVAQGRDAELAALMSLRDGTRKTKKTP